MKRDIRRLNRVKEAVDLIHKAIAGGWTRTVSPAWDSKGRVVWVAVHLDYRAGPVYSRGSVLILFLRHWQSGWQVSYRSRYGYGGRKQEGSVKAANLIHNLSAW